jgi:hypothetical protein
VETLAEIDLGVLDSIKDLNAALKELAMDVLNLDLSINNKLIFKLTQENDENKKQEETN